MSGHGTPRRSPRRGCRALAACMVMLGAAGLCRAAAAAHPDMAPGGDMATAMQMDDTASFGKLMLDQLEWRDATAGEGRAAWDAQGWYGGDYDKLWIKSEGRYRSRAWPLTGGRGVQDADVEVLWNHSTGPWWNLQAGARQDVGAGQARTWGAVGVQGLAPQWIETEATLFVSDAGRIAMRLKGAYDVLLTQRLVLQPFVEANAYSHAETDEARGSGVSDIELSGRLRYEWRRNIAPYVGCLWLHRFGATADLARAAGGSASDLELVAGLRVWL